VSPCALHSWKLQLTMAGALLLLACSRRLLMAALKDTTSSRSTVAVTTWGGGQRAATATTHSDLGRRLPRHSCGSSCNLWLTEPPHCIPDKCAGDRKDDMSSGGHHLVHINSGSHHLEGGGGASSNSSSTLSQRPCHPRMALCVCNLHHWTAELPAPQRRLQLSFPAN
jgi:hypothetical protein